MYQKANELSVSQSSGDEDVLFVLAGHGEIRIGDSASPIKEGDIIAFPHEAKRLLIKSSTPVKRISVFWLLAPSYRQKSLNIPIQTALACSQVLHQMKPKGRAQ